MANKKFSEFVLKTSSSNISHIVGYSGAENVQITPANFVTTGGTGIFLPLVGGTMVGNTTVIDNKKIIFGTANDGLEIFHSGSDSFISDTGTGNLNIKSNGAFIDIQSNSTRINNFANNEIMATFVANGSVSLYNNNSKKFETTSTGISVTGAGLFSSSVTIGDGTSGEIPLTFNSSATDFSLGANGSNFMIGTSSDLDAGNLITLSSAGNLGVGTTNPLQPLQVNGQVLFRTTTADGSKNRFQVIPGGSSDAARLFLYYGNAGDGTLSVQINALGNSYLNGGNLGIGLVGPTAKLHINSGSENLVAKFESTDTEAEIQLIDTTGTASIKSRNDFRFETSGSIKMLLDTSGNLGIGSSNPSSFGKFLVSGTGNLINANATSGAVTFQLYEAGAGRFGITTLDGTAGAKFTLAGTEKMRLSADGNLGVGTQTPTAKIEIESTTNPVLRISNGGGLTPNPKIELFRQNGVAGSVEYVAANKVLVLNNDSSLGGINFNIASSEKMQLSASGSLGIGVSPSQKLDVAGKIRLTDDLQLDSTSPRIDFDNGAAGSLRFFSQSQNATKLTLASNGNAEFTGDVSVGADKFLRFPTAGGTGGNGSINFTSSAFTLTSNNSSAPMIFNTSSSEKMRLTSDGDLGVGITTPSAKVEILSTNLDKKLALKGNFNSQGSAINITLVNQYSVVSSGTQLIIPFTSQGNLNCNTIIKIMGHSARFNNSATLGFTATITVGHTNSIGSSNLLDSTGNVSGIQTSGSNLIINFTTAYTSATADGIFATIEYMTNSVSKSLQPANIVMN